MQEFDLGKTRAHRLKEAEAGFSLLRGRPSTDAIARIAFLDGLGGRERIAFPNQLSNICHAQAADPHPPFEALLRKAPLAKGFFAAHSPAHGVALRPASR